MNLPGITPKIIKVLTIVLAMITAYAWLGFYLLPTVLTSQIPKIIQQQTGRKASLDKIAFNPFTLRCVIQSFKIQEKNGDPFVSFDSFATHINVWQSIKLSALAIEQVTLRKPFAHIARLKNDSFNFADMSKNKSKEEEKKSGGMFPVNISKIAIIDGKFFWEDRHADKAVAEKISPINLTIDNFTTHADKQSKLGLSLALKSGGKLEWKGKIGVNPIVSDGHININGIKLSTLLALASPNKPAFQLQGYELLDTDYKLDYQKDQLKLNLSKAKIEAKDVVFSQNQPNPLTIKVAYLALTSNYKIQQAKDLLKLNADNLKWVLQDAELEQKTAKPLTIKLLDISHEASLNVDMTGKKLELQAKKSKVAVRDLAISVLGPEKQMIKIPAISHETTLTLKQQDKTLQLKSDKSTLDIREIEVAMDAPDTPSRIIKIPQLVQELDFQLDKTDKGMQLAANKAKLNILDFRFKELVSKGKTIDIPSISQEMDIKLNHSEKGMQIASNLAKLTVNKLAFNDQGDNNLTLKVPQITHETNVNVTLADKTWQVDAPKTKITSKDIDFLGLSPNPISIKLPELLVETAYKIDNANDTLNINTKQGKLDLRRLKLTDAKSGVKAADRELATLDSFSVSGIALNLKDSQVLLDNVAARGTNINAWLNPDKTLNFQTLFADTSQSENKKPVHKVSHKTESTKKRVDNPWLIKMNKLALNDSGIDFEDRSLKKPIAMSARPINLLVKNFSSKPGTAIPLQLTVGINKTGNIKVDGKTILQPFSSDLGVAINTIHLKTFQPYVQPFANLVIVDGNVNVDGKLKVAQTTHDTAIKFHGNTEVDDFITRDTLPNSGKHFVKWQKLSLKNMDIDVSGNRYTAESLNLHRPYARVIINKDKTVNINQILDVNKDSKTYDKKTTPAIKTSNKTSQPSGKKLYFRLNSFKIIEGSSDFADLSLFLPFAAPITGLNGGAKGLSSEQSSKINVKLQGNAFELAPVNIQGSVSPFLGDFDIDMDFDGMPMPLVSPYMVQFAGYKVEKGKLSLGLKYAVEKKQLNASNSILIDQLELGEKVDNPDAVSLPLDLAITLLKDSEGKIKLDVPVTGSLEDPKFNVGHLITDALFNVLTKIVTAPFNAIAGLVGSDEDLSVVSFAAGDKKLSAEQMGKLDNIAKALQQKPTLSLEIKGTAFKDQDWPALQKQAMHDSIKHIKAKEDGEANAEYVQLSDDEYKKILANEFIRRYPQLGKKSLFGTPELLDPKGGDFYAVAEKKLFETLPPDRKRLEKLATDRAQAIAKYMVHKEGIPNERIFILDMAIDPERTNKDINCQLSLKAS